MEEQTIKDIISEHPTSYKGIFTAYTWKDIRESYPFIASISLSILFLLSSYFSTKNFFEILSIWTNQVLTIFPNLLGFNLGGYALIIGFGNTDLIQALTKKRKDKKTSIFQKLSGVFAFTLMLQSVAFALAFIVNFSIQLGFSTSIESLSTTINICVILILSFLGLWGLLILPVLVANVFSFGQMHHFHLTKKRVLEAEKQESSEPVQ